ncbi:hypothetical protein N9N67_02035 [Bacteriovoracaceae bacterium]|nr:hypothetical protein [Bacteriovoracaceae bacterium]
MAQVKYMPPSFMDGPRKLIFMDINQAYHQLNFLEDNNIEVVSRLDFNIYKSGYPLFDLVPSENLEVYLPIKKKSTVVCDKYYQSECLRRVNFYKTNFNSYVEPMYYADKYLLFPRDSKSSLYFFHTLKNANQASRFAKKSGFNFVFEFCDGNSKRQLLERYLPANLQFDQYPMTMEIKFANKFKKQKIITNDIKSKRFKISDYHYVLSYPEFYNSASIFFHTFAKGYFHEYPVRTVQGAIFYIYGKKDLLFEDRFSAGMGYKKLTNPWPQTYKLMQELTSTFGAFPHKEMIVYVGEKFSGIEHFGATRTSFFSLGHELYHQYIGRGVFPAGGRSAWIDEGLARWRDGGHWFWRWLPGQPFVDPYSSLKDLPRKYVGLPHQSVYQRRTRNPSFGKDYAYAAGAVFFSHINYKLNDRLNDLLRDFVKSRISSKNYMYNQSDFKKYLAKWANENGYSGLNILNLFNKFFNQNLLD